ncbi:MAG TPA: hypothetical protein VD770_05275, partial [Coxiellaceae bacterium]|nr:hypothetical protein [Coxiellaceae bacterium]
MRFGNEHDLESPSTGLFAKLGEIAWWTAKQLTRVLAVQSSFAPVSGSSNSLRGSLSALPSNNALASDSLSLSNYNQSSSLIPNPVWSADHFSAYANEIFTDSNKDSLIKNSDESTLTAALQHTRSAAMPVVTNFTEAQYEEFHRLLATEKSVAMNTFLGMPKTKKPSLRGERNLAVACPITITQPTGSYTENSNYQLGIQITNSGVCVAGTLSASFVLINPSFGQIGNSGCTNLGSSVNFGDTGTTSYTFNICLAPTQYSTVAASIFVSASTSLGSLGSAVITIPGIQIRIPLQITGSATLPELDLNVGNNAPYQLPLSTSILNYNNYPLVVSTNASLSWLNFLNNQTGLTAFTPSVGTQNYAATIFYKVAVTTDSTNYVTLMVPTKVNNRLPTISPVIIPNIDFGNALNTTLSLPPNANSFIADGDGVADICEGIGGTPPCRISLVNAPAWVSLDNNTGLLFGNPPTAPAQDSSISYTIPVAVRDSVGGTALSSASVQVASSLKLTNTNVAQITQGSTTAIPLSVTTPGTPSVLVSIPSSAGTLKVIPESGVSVSPASGKASSLTISGANTNNVLATLELIGSSTNRDPVTLTIISSDDKGQQRRDTTTFSVVAVNHPFTATTIPVGSVSTISTQVALYSIANSNLVNIDNEKWLVNSAQVFASSGTLVADNTQTNGWTFTGLNGTPTNQLAQIGISSPEGSQAAYTVSFAIQAVDSDGVALSGMPALELNSTLSIVSAPFTIPSFNFNSEKLSIGVQKSFVLPAVTMIGDTFTDEVSGDSVVSYNPSTRTLVVYTTTNGPLSYTRTVCPTHDASACASTTYSTTAQTSLAVTSLTSVTSVQQDELSTIPLFNITTPGAPSVILSVNGLPISQQPTLGTAGYYFTQTGTEQWQLNLAYMTPNRQTLVVAATINDDLGQSFTAPTRTLAVLPTVHPATAATPLTNLATSPTQTVTLIVGPQNINDPDSDSWTVADVKILNSDNELVASSTNLGAWSITGVNGTPGTGTVLISIIPPASSQDPALTAEIDLQFYNGATATKTLALSTSFAINSANLVVPPSTDLNAVQVGVSETRLLPAVTYSGDSITDQVSGTGVMSYDPVTRLVTIKATDTNNVIINRRVCYEHDANACSTQSYSVSSQKSLLVSALSSVTSIQQDELTDIPLYTIATPGTPSVTLSVNSLPVSAQTTSGAPGYYFTETSPGQWQLNLVYVTTSRQSVVISASISDDLDQTASMPTRVIAVAPTIHPATAAIPLSNLATVPTQATTFAVSSQNINDPDGDLWTVAEIKIRNRDGDLVASSTNPDAWIISGTNTAAGTNTKLISITPPRDGQNPFLSVDVELQFYNSAGTPTKTLALDAAFAVNSASITIPTQTISQIGVNQNRTVILSAPVATGATLVDSIINLPEGWTYDSSTRTLTMHPSSAGTVILTRLVCDLADPAQCSTQNYNVGVVPTIVVSDTVNSQLFSLGRDFSFALPIATSPVGYSITVSLVDTTGNPAPAWLQPNPLTGVIGGAIPVDAATTYNLVPIYIDEAGNQLRLSPFTLNTQKALQVQIGSQESISQGQGVAYLNPISYAYPGNAPASVR